MMRPVLLYDSGEFTDGVSLKELFSEDYAVDDLAFLVCRGGWSLSVDLGRKAAL